MEVKKKKERKDDILTVVADLHRPFVFSVALKPAPKAPSSAARRQPNRHTYRAYVFELGQEEFHKLRLKTLRLAGPEKSTLRARLLYHCQSERNGRKITTHLVPKSVYGGDVFVVNFNMGKTVTTVGPRCVEQEGGKGRREGLT